jgi:hypothetical protein
LPFIGIDNFQYPSADLWRGGTYLVLNHIQTITLCIKPAYGFGSTKLRICQEVLIIIATGYVRQSPFALIYHIRFADCSTAT